MCVKPRLDVCDPEPDRSWREKRQSIGEADLHQPGTVYGVFLAAVTTTSCGKGKAAMSYEQLQRMYGGDEYYWGREPNGFALRVMSFLPSRPEGGKWRAVDIGCGEGRDAVLFAERGLDVLGVDVIPNALAKAIRLARERGVEIRVERGDINTLELAGTFDLVYSIGAIQYFSPENRPSRFGHLKDRTAPGGIHALFAFVDHPDVPPAPDLMADEHLYAPGELPGYYAGWEILHSRGFVFDDDSGGTPHLHAAEEYVFQKLR